MTDIKDNIAASIASRFNWQARAVRVGLTAAIAIGGFAIDKMRTKAAFDRGWNEYEQALREGSAELDGQIIEAITQADKEELVRVAKIEAERDAYQAAQAEFGQRLRDITNDHTRAITAVSRRQFTPEEKDWRDVRVPSTTSLRFNKLDATRQSGDGGGNTDPLRD